MWNIYNKYIKNKFSPSRKIILSEVGFFLSGLAYNLQILYSKYIPVMQLHEAKFPDLSDSILLKRT